MGSWLGGLLVLAVVVPVAVVVWGIVQLFRRRYDYWVGAALAAEDDPRKQAKYLTRALAINPDYVPAWGLKAAALLALERYGEAMECFEIVLKIDPNPRAWYEKGLCCCHLGRFQEAVQCFDRALADGSETNGKLRDDALRQRKLAEAQVDRQDIV
jgi:pentatricopeptide repeat protein